VGQVKFTGQVLPTAKLVTYEIDIRRVVRGRLKMVIADGRTLGRPRGHATTTAR